ncbi:MAG: AI-2E family transporter [Acidobacteriaceae bacterium]
MSDNSIPDSTPTTITATKPNRRRADILFAIAMVILVCAAWHVRRELIILYVSALFAVVFMPVVRGIMKLRIGKWSPNRGFAVFLLFLAIAVGITVFSALALPPILHDLSEFGKEMPTRGPQILSRLHKFPFSDRLNFSELFVKLQGIESNLATYVLSSIRELARTAFDVIIGVVLTVYFMLEGETAYFWLLSLVPGDKRKRLDATLVRAEGRMGKWLLGQGLLMLILGVLSTVVFLALKVRYAYALGVLMGLFNLVPVVGALISVTLVVLVAAVDSWGRVLGVLIFYVVYAQVETSYLTPRIMRTSVDLAGLSVLIALLLGSAFAGVIGAMVAVPTAVLIAVLLDEYAVKTKPIVSPDTPPAEAKPPRR